MLNGNLFCSSSLGLQNGHTVFITSCFINRESQLSKSLRHLTPSASSRWNIPYRGMFKEHHHPFKISKCCTALWYVILKGSQNLLSYCCYIFPKDSFIILIIWHHHLRGKPPKRFITAFFFHPSIVQQLFSPFHEQLGPVACDRGPNITAWASLITCLEHRNNHPRHTEYYICWACSAASGIVIVPQTPPLALLTRLKYLAILGNFD